MNKILATLTGLVLSFSVASAQPSSYSIGPGYFSTPPLPRNFYYSSAGFAPTAITTNTYSQYGLGSSWKLTPALGGSGRVRVVISGYSSCASPATGNYTINGSYGLVSNGIPANGVTQTGTLFQAVGITGTSATPSALLPFPIAAEISGLTPGVQYWFDLVGSQGGICSSSVSVEVTTISIEEIR